jgi:hypothetical protein
LSYGAWGGLVVGLRGSMIFVYSAGAVLSLITFYYVLKWSKINIGYIINWVAVSLLCGVVSSHWEVVGLVVVGPIDLAWYIKAVRDLKRSEVGKAVSLWGWVMSFTAAVAWAVEGLVVERWGVFAQSTAIAVAAIVAGTTTLVVHRRRIST